MRRGDYCRQHRARRVGRPTSFTAETQGKILDALRAGVYPSTAAAYGGVSYETLGTWMRTGEADLADGRETEHAAFSAAVSQVSASVEVCAVGLIQKAATGDWRAAAWWLEHALPMKYGKREVREIEHRSTAGMDELLGGRQPAAISRATREKIIELIAADAA